MDNFTDVKDSIGDVINTDTISGQVLFVLAVLFLVYVTIKIIFMIMTYVYTSGAGEVTLLNGKIAGDQIKEFTQNPNDSIDCTGPKCSRPLLLSKNSLTGIEYTWSFWLNINPEKSWFTNDNDRYDVTSCVNSAIPDEIYSCSEGSYSDTNIIHIFHKGDNANETNANDTTLINGVKLHNNSPGVYLGLIDHTSSNNHNIDASGIGYNKTIALLIYMDTIEGPSARRGPITIPNKKKKKWVNVVLIARQSTLYVYVNGVLKDLHTYKNVFKLNYDSVHIGDPTNYGELSSLKYWNRAISGYEVASLISNGPNLTPIESNSYPDEYPKYLDMTWYDN